MRSLTIVLVSALLSSAVEVEARDYPRALINSGRAGFGTEPFPSYDPFRLMHLYNERRALDMQMFDAINEAALRRDKSLRPYLDNYGSSLGYIPPLAPAHDKWVFGHKSQLDWLIAEDRKSGFGHENVTMLVFGYMDEWDKTIKELKERNAYLNHGSGGGAASEVLSEAIEIRKRLYGGARFEKAWKAAGIR